MPISVDSLRGYILEEVLAFLIRRTGYNLLVDPKQDSRDLAWHRGGLAVKGRGGMHQVDVLGQLEWIPAFTFPLRLFVEAKFRKGRAGIDVVRNAIGILLDINQNNSPLREKDIFPQRYNYAYALFSTSGFSPDAMNMALAHQISLIDLSGSDFTQLRHVIDQAASANVDRFGGESNKDIYTKKGKTISEIRSFFRHRLGTMPPGIQVDIYDRSLSINAFEPVIDVARQYNELFVAMPNGPFMLALKADNPQAFIRYAMRKPRHKVEITWSMNIDNGQTWFINSADERDAYRLSFKLPEIIRRWIFDTSANARDRARHAKHQYLSAITIYRFDEDRDQLFRLEYDLESTRRRIAETHK